MRPLLEGGAWSKDRAIPLTLADGWSYEAIRTERELYMKVGAARKRESPEPARELYGMRSDPHQLDTWQQTRGQTLVAKLKALARRLDRATSCAGIKGRDALTADRPFCE